MSCYTAYSSKSYRRPCIALEITVVLLGISPIPVAHCPTHMSRNGVSARACIPKQSYSLRPATLTEIHRLGPLLGCGFDRQQSLDHSISTLRDRLLGLGRCFLGVGVLLLPFACSSSLSFLPCFPFGRTLHVRLNFETKREDAARRSLLTFQQESPCQCLLLRRKSVDAPCESTIWRRNGLTLHARDRLPCSIEIEK